MYNSLLLPDGDLLEDLRSVLEMQLFHFILHCSKHALVLSNDIADSMDQELKLRHWELRH